MHMIVMRQSYWTIRACASTTSPVIKSMEMPGIEPGASHMQSVRSTTELHPLTCLRSNLSTNNSIGIIDYCTLCYMIGWSVEHVIQWTVIIIFYSRSLQVPSISLFRQRMNELQAAHHGAGIKSKQQFIQVVRISNSLVYWIFYPRKNSQ